MEPSFHLCIFRTYLVDEYGCKVSINTYCRFRRESCKDWSFFFFLTPFPLRLFYFQWLMILQPLITAAQMGPIDQILPPLTLGPQGLLVDEFSSP